MFGSCIMTYTAYITVQNYDGKKLYENGNMCSVVKKIWMIVDNTMISHIYVVHAMFVAIHISWNTDKDLTLFFSDFVHVAFVICIYYWTPPKTF